MTFSPFFMVLILFCQEIFYCYRFDLLLYMVFVCSSCTSLIETTYISNPCEEGQISALILSATYLLYILIVYCECEVKGLS